MPPLDAPFPAHLDASELSAQWLPFTANRAFRRRPRLIDRAEGMHYCAVDGRKPLDTMSGLWCCNAGHCREPIVEAIRRQAGRLDCAPAFQSGHVPAFQLASRLAKLAGGELGHVLFCNSGSEAVDSALKIALAYHKLAGASTRTRFVSRDRSYHGSCFGGTSVGGIAPNRNLFEPLLDVDQIRSTYSRESARLMRVASLPGAATSPTISPPSSRSRSARRSPPSWSSRWRVRPASMRARKISPAPARDHPRARHPAHFR